MTLKEEKLNKLEQRLTRLKNKIEEKETRLHMLKDIRENFKNYIKDTRKRERERDFRQTQNPSCKNPMSSKDNKLRVNIDPSI
jgi:predicted  nucleic acid-binding Zn-ribbon protein